MRAWFSLFWAIVLCVFLDICTAPAQELMDRLERSIKNENE